MYRKILVATDGSELAARGVEQGVRLARETGASIVLVTVTEMWSAMEMADMSRSGEKNPVIEYEQAAREAATKILSQARQVADAAGVKVETVHVSDQAPADGIIAAADQHGCDLIVMATHGRRGLNRLLLGSQTTQVLHYAKVPVLVVR